MTPEAKLLLIVSALPLLFGAVIVFFNATYLVRSTFFGKNESLAPVMGGVALSIGFLLFPLLPWPWRLRMAVLAFVIDFTYPLWVVCLLLCLFPPFRRWLKARERAMQEAQQDQSSLDYTEESPVD